MKLRALASTCAIIAGIAAASMAVANPLSNGAGVSRAGDLIQKISCDIHNEDKQALCMQACDDEFIKASQGYSAAGKLDEPKAVKKECETKCGC
jgi:hypothetical protein